MHLNRLRRGVAYSTLAALPFGIALLTANAADAVAGSTATDASYGFVAKISTGTSACTGVLVDSRWVLTSSTCFPDTTKPGAPAHPATITVGRPDLTTTTGHTVQAASVIPRPDRNLALVRLDTAVTDIAPITLATTAPQAGDTVSLAGFGRTATDWVPDQLHITTAGIASLGDTTLAVNGSTCKGDAGGPAFRQNNGHLELLAVNHSSWQSGCFGETETRTGATEARTDDLHDWLVQQTTSPIVARYLDLGGATSFLGAAVGVETTVSGGSVQDYEHGAIYYSSASGAHWMEGPILQHYRELGGPASLGFPATDETATPDGVGRYNHFNHPDGASIYWTPTTGAHEIHGAIRNKWAAMGWERGLGYPVNDEVTTTDGAHYNDFSLPDGASIYWTSTTGAYEIQGDIRKKWLAMGAGPRLGYPTTDESITPDGIGRYNHFNHPDGASIYWTPNTGAHQIQGAIRNKWAAMGWETGPGYPTTDETTTPDGIGRFNHFTNNTSIYWSPSSGVHSVVGTIRDTWASLGWERSRLGYPTSDEYGIAGGRRSDFQHGYITWNASNNTTQVFYS
ncbi:LGFP repeat-containing protein [Amycolatopsis sacchari]|uniref:LGFP repeat-containing protein n=1 Tax=Amycolatopsis sacchari TaxID=115433 RepID=A0A1I3ZJM1_9PSEU|nr:LGFP repeat-containing protein [Amycolatopsis sacchari]